jgi:hypothetical protein
MLNALSFATSQGLNVGLDKSSVASLGFSYYLRLNDSLCQNLPLNNRKEKVMETVDAYFLAVSDIEGSA